MFSFASRDIERLILEGLLTKSSEDRAGYITFLTSFVRSVPWCCLKFWMLAFWTVGGLVDSPTSSVYLFNIITEVLLGLVHGGFFSIL